MSGCFYQLKLLGAPLKHMSVMQLKEPVTIEKDSPFHIADSINTFPVTQKSDLYSYYERDVQILRMLEKHRLMTPFVIANLFWPKGSTLYKERLKYLTRTGFMARYELRNQGSIVLTVYGVGPNARRFFPDLNYEPVQDPMQAIRYAATNRFYLALRQLRYVPEFEVKSGYISAKFRFAFVATELLYTLCTPRAGDNVEAIIQMFRNLPPSDSRLIILASSRAHAEYLAGTFEQAGVMVPMRFTWDREMVDSPVEEMFWSYQDNQLIRAGMA